MTSKKFTLIFVGVVALFVLLNLGVWEFATKKIFYPPNGCIVGDIARLAYDPSVINLRPNEDVTLQRTHHLYNGKQANNIDMITFGDSFTRGGAGGENPYFQDYIATYNDMNVLHFHDYKNHYNCVNSLLIMISSGLIDEIKPKYVLLESAQRECVRRLSQELNFDFKYTKDEVKKYYTKFDTTPFNVVSKQPLKFINSGNLKYLVYEFLYNFNDRAFVSKVYRMKLLSSYAKNIPYMLIYKDDIRFSKLVNEASIKAMNNNLNKIGEILASKGIKFYFMPAPDKFTLYNSYFKDKGKYPSNNFFKLVREQAKPYYNFIDTESILNTELSKGVRDLYFLDDTHWTHKAAEAIFSKVKFSK